MSGPPELFNPNEFTEKELVKLIYRDLVKLRLDFDEFIKEDITQKELAELKIKIITLEAELKTEKELRQATEKQTKKLLAIAGVIVTAVQVLLGAFFGYFKR